MVTKGCFYAHFQTAISSFSSTSYKSTLFFFMLPELSLGCACIKGCFCILFPCLNIHVSNFVIFYFVKAKIVETLLGCEVVQVSCGTSHILAVTNDNEVYAWGRGDNGEISDF